jgi:hypothetical protein
LFLISVSPSLLQQLILLTLTLITQMDLSPSPQKIHQVVKILFIVFTQQ